MPLTLTNVESKLFQSITLTVKDGEGLGIYGRNGVGKTTLLNMIAGLKTMRGAVSLPGKIGYVMQNDTFVPYLSCRDNLLLEASLCGYSRKQAKKIVEDIAVQCLIKPFIHQKFLKCSAGMKARVSIAAALLGSPRLLLLDEPFTALDETAAAALRQLLTQLKREGAILVIVSHDRDDFVDLCGHILRLPESKVLTYEDFKASFG